MIKIIAATLFVILLSACNRDSFVENKGIVGRWQLISIYQGYVNGGNFKWNDVKLSESETLSFSDSKEYSLTRSGTGNVECTGTYQMQNDSTAAVTSSCQTITEILNLSELTPTQMIIDRQGREGIVRYKYKSIK